MVAHDPDEDARRLSGEALRRGDATGWFERLYAEAADGQAIVPWDRGAPHPLLVEWIEQVPMLAGRRTLVVGFRPRRRRGVPGGPGISCDRF